MNAKKLLSVVKPTKWRALYSGFIRSPHFAPWFAYRRQRCIRHFTVAMRPLRRSVGSELLLQAPNGDAISLAQCRELKKEIKLALEAEKSRADADPRQLRAMKAHLKAVKQRLREAQQAR